MEPQRGSLHTSVGIVSIYGKFRHVDRQRNSHIPSKPKRRRRPVVYKPPTETSTHSALILAVLLWWSLSFSPYSQKPWRIKWINSEKYGGVKRLYVWGPSFSLWEIKRFKFDRKYAYLDVLCTKEIEVKNGDVKKLKSRNTCMKTRWIILLLTWLVRYNSATHWIGVWSVNWEKKTRNFVTVHSSSPPTTVF